MSEQRLHHRFWQVSVFYLTAVICILFLILTLIAMLLYPGGTLTHPHRHRYSFFSNFLSDLGRFSTPSGQPNLASMALFTSALTMGAVGIVLFFIAFTQLFPDRGLARLLSRVGAVFGVVASLCFLGVAGVPLDLSEQVHMLFLDTAFVSFLVAFFLIFLAVVCKPDLPQSLLVIFGIFALVLIGYTVLIVGLLLFGPASGTVLWEIVQATGQKVIVFASMVTAFILSLKVPPLLVKNTALLGSDATGSTSSPLY